jgi:hypothetical protein
MYKKLAYTGCRTPPDGWFHAIWIAACRSDGIGQERHIANHRGGSAASGGANRHDASQQPGGPCGVGATLSNTHRD